MEFETVDYETADGIAHVTLDRPDVRNVLDRRMMDELGDVWDAFVEDDDAHVAVVSGAGEDFCAGGRPRRRDGRDHRPHQRGGAPPDARLDGGVSTAASASTSR